MKPRLHITDQQIDAFLEKHCNLTVWMPDEENIPMYVWKTDGEYACFENLKRDLDWIIRAGIDDQIGHGIGFHTKEQKWYAWARAVCSFGIGDEIKFGYPGYVAIDEQDLIRQAVDFWSDDARINVSGIIATNEQGVRGVQVTWEYVPEKVLNKSLHGTIGEAFYHPPKQWGRGEWKAETLEQAKQMALDARESMS